MKKMKKALFKKGVTGGTIDIPPAKSYGHRSIICAALSDNCSCISNMDMSEDMKATLNFLKALGGSFTYENSKLTLTPVTLNENECIIDCGESGSTLRFIIPIIAALGVKAELIGHGRLPERPLTVYTDLLPDFGVSFSSNKLPMKVSGKLKPGIFKVPGNISSQFISGLLFALPMLESDSEIQIIGDLESGAYIDMTTEMLSLYGIKTVRTEKGWFVPGNQKYKATDYTVEGDWSQAAFFLTMGALSEEPIKICGLKKDSIQGDKEALKLYEKIGAEIEFEGDVLSIRKGELKALTADMHDMPDAVPAFAACLALCEGKSIIKGAARLRIKESDRLKSTSDALNKLGAVVHETSEGLEIIGVKGLTGGKAESCNDHRILMAMASLRAVCDNDIEMTDPGCINKSYPGFYEDYKKLGGEINVIDLG